MSHNGQATEIAKWPYAERLAAVYADLLRMNILAECNEREISPRGFHREVGGATLPKIAQAFELLAQYGWLECTRSEETDDPEEVERFYRGTGEAIVDEAVWEELPDSTQALVTGRIVDQFVRRMRRAMKGGTITARRDTHLTWSPLVLDREGWRETIELLDSAFHGVREIGRQAKARLAEGDEEPIAMTVGLFGFESPRDGPRGS
jgi:hypothetical protein